MIRNLESHRNIDTAVCISLKPVFLTDFIGGKTKVHIRLEFLIHQGPVVQSIVNLTTSLRHQLKCMWTTLSNTLLFFVGKM